MAGFSIDAALKSGFRLAKREPLAVFVWGVGYSLLGLLIQAIALGPALPGYVATVGKDPEAAAAQMEQAAGANAVWSLPIMMILGIGAAAVFYGAVVRALLHPEERRFFYLRTSKRELWLILTSLVLVLGTLAVVLTATFLVGTLGSLIGGGSGVLFAIPAVVGFIYLAARFSTAWVQSFDERRLVVLEGWRLTKGHGWRIVLMLLALVFLLMILAVVVMLPAGIVGGILIGVASMAGGASGGVVLALVAIAALVLFSGFYGFFLVVAVAPYVEIYRSLKGVGLPGGDTAEVFA